MTRPVRADPAQLRRAMLGQAMRDGDREVFLAVRDMLAALANTETVAFEPVRSSTVGDQHFAGRRLGWAQTKRHGAAWTATLRAPSSGP